jgi:hypothetical protein
MFGMANIPPPPIREWQVQQQLGMAQLEQILAESRRTNELLESLKTILFNRLPRVVSDAGADNTVIERLEWLERQVDELKGLVIP